jgi:hypothetical protein
MRSSILRAPVIVPVLFIFAATGCFAQSRTSSRATLHTNTLYGDVTSTTGTTSVHRSAASTNVSGDSTLSVSGLSAGSVIYSSGIESAPTTGTTTGTLTFAGGTGVVSGSGLAWATTTAAGNYVTCNSQQCWTTNGQLAETRPFDKKGPTLEQVEESAVELPRDQLAPSSYLALAKEVKLESPSSDEAQMLNTIFDHEFHVYSFDKVDNYLYRQALSHGTQMKWGWKPMRAADLKEVQSIGNVPVTNGVVFTKLYAQRVPTRILEDVKCVLDEVPNAVFLVSDFESVKPDPFLAVTTPKLLSEGKLWIVDRWDEPGFDDGRPVKAKLSNRISQ